MFQYKDEGFSWKEFDIKWDDIEEIRSEYFFAHLLDKIELQIVYKRQVFVVNEDTLGWHQLLQHLEQNIQDLPSLQHEFLHLFANGKPTSVIIWKKDESFGNN